MALQLSINLLDDLAGFFAGLVDVGAAGEADGEAAFAGYGGFAEEAELSVGFGEGLVEVTEVDLFGVSGNDVGAGGASSVLLDVGDGEAENGAGVEGELAEVLGNHGDHSSVVGAGGDFGEDDFVSFNEEFHSEESVATEVGGDFLGHLFRALASEVAHGLWLPAFAVIAVHLNVSDGLAEGGSVPVTESEEGDFVIEFDKAFYDDFACSGATAFLGVFPSGLNVFGGAEGGLTFTRGRHDGFDDARKADFVDGGFEFFGSSRKLIRGSEAAEFFRGHASNPFAIHGELGGAGGGDDGSEAFAFEFGKGVGGDGFDFGDDEVWLLEFDDFSQGFTIEHGKNVRAVRYLHGGGVGVSVAGDDFDSVTLEFDDDLFAEFA